MQLETRPQRSDQVLARQGGDSLILLDIKSGCYYTLEGVGARVWELCDGSTDVSEIVAMVSSEYEVEPEMAKGDVVELLGELSRERLVKA
jgi:hypothetical protein